MIEQLEHHHAVADDLDALAEETTELGLLAEDIFKNASASLLIGYEPDAARSAIEHAHICTQMYRALHRRSLELLGQHLASGENIRPIAEVQQIAAEFARIADAGRQLAEHALALGGAADAHLLLAGGDAPLILVQLVRQAYIEIRGCVIAATTRDTVLAKRLIAEDGELDRTFLSFKSVLEQAVAQNRESATPLHRLLMIGVLLEAIGNHVVAICQTLIFAPPSL